ncbi:hypothetical protein RhiLY_11458 [Ceratobasidium sp. AG-Ba]|nr:hypothetical protein RhiLY_11458 [Ceratobasidium sp. AG-Ba]
MSNTTGDESPAYPTIGAFDAPRRSSPTMSPRASGSDTVRGTPSRGRTPTASPLRSPLTPSSQRTVGAPSTMQEFPNSRGIFRSPQPYGSSYIQAPIGSRFNRAQQSTSGTRYTASGNAYSYAPTAQIPRAADGPSTSTPRADIPPSTSQPRLSTETSREQAAERRREQMQLIASNVIQEHTRSIDQRMSRLESMIENLTVQFNSIDNTSVAGSICSVRRIVSARTELGPEPRYDDDTIGREDSTDQLPLPDVDNEMRPGSVQDRTGTPSRVVEGYLANCDRRSGFHTIEEEPDEDAAGVHPNTRGIPTELGYDGPIIREIIDDERQQRTAAPDGQGVTPLPQGPDERAMRAQRRREPLQVPAISKPGDGRRMSLAGTGDLPSRAPYTPIPRTSALYNARLNNRLARGSVRSPVATPIVQRVPGVNPALAQVAPQPRAAGYPIGAVPTDSISHMVINTLQAHQNDVDSQRNLGRKGLKLEPRRHTMAP